jgi:hypothetical protein
VGYSRKRERDAEGTKNKQRLTYIAEMEETVKGLKEELAHYKADLSRVYDISEFRREEGVEETAGNRVKISRGRWRGDQM